MHLCVLKMKLLQQGFILHAWRKIASLSYFWNVAGYITACILFFFPNGKYSCRSYIIKPPFRYTFSVHQDYTKYKQMPSPRLNSPRKHELAPGDTKSIRFLSRRHIFWYYVLESVNKSNVDRQMQGTIYGHSLDHKSATIKRSSWRGSCKKSYIAFGYREAQCNAFAQSCKWYHFVN